MAQDMCMFYTPGEDNCLAWIKIHYDKNNATTSMISKMLESEVVSVIFATVDNFEYPDIGKFYGFIEIRKEELKNLIISIESQEYIVDVEYDISKNRLIHSIDFPFTILGGRAIITRALTFVDIIKIIRENVHESEGILVYSGLKGGKHAARHVNRHLKVDINNFADILKELFQAAGWGLLNIEYDHETHEGTITVRDSFVSDVYQKSEEPVCAYMSGFFSGYLSESLGEDIYVKEIKCQSSGHPECEHQIRAATLLDQQISINR